MAKRKKYYQGRKDRMDESKAMKNRGNAGWFGVSEGDNGMPPKEVITRYSDPYSGANMYYEQGMAYQDKQMKEVEKGVQKQKLDRHF